MGVSNRPSDFSDDRQNAQTIMELLDLGIKVPKMPSVDVKHLEFRSYGINSVHEALSQRPIDGLDRWTLCRMATRIATCRMEVMPVVLSLQEKRSVYLDKRKHCLECVRVRYDELLSKVALAYTPITKKTSCHLQLWSDSHSKETRAVLVSAGLTQPLFHIFVADALADIPDLDEITVSLKREVDFGIAFLGILDGIYDNVIQKM